MKKGVLRSLLCFLFFFGIGQAQNALPLQLKDVYKKKHIRTKKFWSCKVDERQQRVFDS